MLPILYAVCCSLLGAGLLWFDSNRQTAYPLERRPFWGLMLTILGMLTVLSGVGMGVLACLLVFRNAPESSGGSLPLSLGLSLLVILTGVQTLRVKRTWPEKDEDWTEESVIDRVTPHTLMSEPSAARLRGGAWLMALSPLVPGVAGLGFASLMLPGFVCYFLGFPAMMLFIGGVFAVGSLAFSKLVRSPRVFQSQLLCLLAVCTRNQMPLADEFRSLALGQRGKLRFRLELAADDLDEGIPLWKALETYRLLPAATLSAIRVSEDGSRLSETLRQLAAQAFDRLKAVNGFNLGEVLLQCTIQLAFAAQIVGGIMYFIIPKYKTIFEGFGVELPGATVELIHISDAIVTGAPVVYCWTGLLFTGLIWFGLRHTVGWSSLRFPALMQWFPRRDAPEVLRALGGIAREGVSLPQRMSSLMERPGRPDLGARYQRIADSLSAGETLSNALYAQGLVTRLQQEAVAAGERGGHLEVVLFSLADALEGRESRRAAFWSELIKPISIVACGLVVGFIVIALFVPLVKLLSELS